MEVVTDSIDPLLVATVGIVANLESVIPGFYAVGLLPEFPGFVRVVGEDVIARHIEVNIAQGGGGEFFGGGAGAEEDFVRNEWAVDGHGDGGAAQAAFFTLEVGEPFGDDEGTGAGGGFVVVAGGEVGLEVR